MESNVLDDDQLLPLLERTIHILSHGSASEYDNASAVKFHPDEYPCIYCPAHYSIKQEQAEHLWLWHASSTPWLCHECPDSFAALEDLFHHIGRTHRDSLLSHCLEDGCGRPLASEDMRRRHQTQDHDEQTLTSHNQCLQPDCDFSNESHIGLSLHALHVHPYVDAALEAYNFGLAAHTAIENDYLKSTLTEPDGVPSGLVAHASAFDSPPGICNLHRYGENETAMVRTQRIGGSPALMPKTDLEVIDEWLSQAEGLARNESSYEPLPLRRALPNTTSSYQSSPPNVETPIENQQLTPMPRDTEQLPPLPLSITKDRFNDLTEADFDANAIYFSTVVTQSRYKDFPPDLPDEHAFNADPKLIAYGNILRLATRHSNKDILQQVNEGRPRPVFRSVQVVESRVRSALTRMAERSAATHVTLTDAKEWLVKERAKHGITTKKQ